MFKSKNAFLLPLLLLSFMALGVIIGGLVTGNRLAPETLSGQQSDLSKMQDIIDVLDQRYVDPIKRNELFEETISDMLHKLDPHSNYIPAAEMQLANEQIEGKFGGVGVRFAIIRDTLCVTHVIPNSPSEKAGVKAGDRIIKIDGKVVAGKKITNEKVMGMLKGVENTKVNVTLLRGKQQLNKEITRGIIPIESIVCAIMLDKETGYIRLDQFSVNSSLEFSQAAKHLLRKGMKKLIFDLRDNGGGVLTGATQIADEFLTGGKDIVDVRGAHIKSDPYTSKSGDLLENIQVAVLINENSASASEIFAGAIQDNDRGTMIGRRSFGKGLVQQDFGLKDGSNLRLTIARYYTPSGRSIQKPYDGDYQHYYHDSEEREERGELFAPGDTSKIPDSLKFKTPKGKTVYGGGGIMPDIFVPIDTSNSTWYYVQLRYSPVFQHFAFDFVKDKRTKWNSPEAFNRTFNVTPEMVNELAAYAAKKFKIQRNESELRISYDLIRQTMKAEIARQLFLEQGYFTVTTQTDDGVQRALQFFRTGK